MEGREQREGKGAGLIAGRRVNPKNSSKHVARFERLPCRKWERFKRWHALAKIRHLAAIFG